MPRKPRQHAPGGLYHVMLRGNNRRQIFFSDDDRMLWSRLIGEGLARYECRLHSYCWMTNHVHMALQVDTQPLSSLIHWLASQYAHRINWDRGRTGHLFERRYGAKIVSKDSYLLQLVRYIHNNPVEAGMVDDPGGYEWSSHRAYLGHTRTDWLTTHWVLAFFQGDLSAARRAYLRFMEDESDNSTAQPEFDEEPDRLETANVDFLERLEEADKYSEQTETLERIVTSHCRRFDVKKAALASDSRDRRLVEARASIAAEAAAAGVATIAEVAARFNRSKSGLCRAVRLRRRPRRPPK